MVQDLHDRHDWQAKIADLFSQHNVVVVVIAAAAVAIVEAVLAHQLQTKSDHVYT